MVALDREVTLRGEPEVRKFAELACRDLRLPVGARELVLDDLLSIEPVFDALAVDDDARLVPLAVPPDDSRGRCVQAVVGSGRSQAVFPVRRVGVVEELVLRRTPEDV